MLEARVALRQIMILDIYLSMSTFVTIQVRIKNILKIKLINQIKKIKYTHDSRY